MKRLIDYHLVAWKTSDQRKPLILRGARQVGKTHAVRTLGKSFDDFVEINVELETQALTIFEQDLHPDRIIRELGILIGRPIIPGKTLLFFDEIQSSPRVLLSLRYFYELLPELHVLAAGSLLDFTINHVGIPVGRVMSFYLYPMSFIEFLSALDQPLLVEEILSHEPEVRLSNAIHSKILEFVGEYLAIGGMPEAVQTWKTKKDFFACAQIHQTLIDTYRQDFNKYAKSHQLKYIRELFNHIPERLGKKFKYHEVSGDYQKRELAPCLDLLETAGIVNKAIWSAGNGIPLGAHVDQQDFKVVFLDIALSQTVLGLNLGTWIINPLEQFINKGDLVEAFVGQEILAYSNPFQKASLYYWHRTARNSQAEIDYLIQSQESIIPIEVKSGAGTTLKSMQLFLEGHPNTPHGVRFSTQNYSIFQKIHSYPLYAIAKVLRYTNR